MFERQFAHLVFLRRGSVLLVKRPEADWRQLQDEYDGFMTSLGPWPEEHICEYFSIEYGPDDRRWPFTRPDVAEFMRATDRHVLESQS